MGRPISQRWSGTRFCICRRLLSLPGRQQLVAYMDPIAVYNAANDCNWEMGVSAPKQGSYRISFILLCDERMTETRVLTFASMLSNHIFLRYARGWFIVTLELVIFEVFETVFVVQGVLRKPDHVFVVATPKDEVTGSEGGTGEDVLASVDVLGADSTCVGLFETEIC